MAEPGPASPLLVDLGALLDHIGERGVPLTDTGRLRMVDVRAINDRFAAPAELSERFGEHIHRAKREDEVWRVHFVRLAAQAAGLLDARLGRVHRTASARRFERLAPEEAERRLFVAWWWKGAWDLLSLAGAIDVRLMRDRLVTGSALAELGTLTYRIGALGARLREAFGAPGSSQLALGDEAWGFAGWRVCMEPLAAFGGARPTFTTREVNGHRFKDLAALALTERGVALVQAALAARPAIPARVRRGMGSAYPVAQRGAGHVSEQIVEDERRERILAAVPEPAEDAEEVDAPEPLPPAHLSASDRERLRCLSRGTRVWEGDLTDLPIEIEHRGAPLCALWTDGDGTVRAVLPDVGAEPGQLVLAAFVRAALQPQAGRAELPACIRVHPEIASALRGPLGEVGVVVEEADELPLAHEALGSLAEFLARPPGLRPSRRRRRSQ